MKIAIGRIALAATLGVGVLTAGVALAQSKLPQKVDACSLLKDEEVAKAIGLTVSPGKLTDLGYTPQAAYSTTCVWEVKADAEVAKPNEPLSGKRFAILNVQSFPKGKADAYLESFREASRNREILLPPLSLKIGDEAVWWGDGIAVRKGDVSFGISILVPKENEKHRERAETLARRIVSRL